MVNARQILDDEQLVGARFLAAKPVAMLADEPGVGKTAQIVRACEYVQARTVTGITRNNTLALNTAREFDKWALWGFGPVTILDSGKADVPPTGVVLTTYALSIKPRIRRLLRERRADVLFCDEAHALKETSSRCTVSILGSTSHPGGAGIATTAKHVWHATGTPVPNHAGELFVFAKTSGIWPGNFASWVNEFCITREDDYGSKIVGSKNHDKLRALLAPVYLRRPAKTDKPRISELVVAGKSDPYAALPAEDRAKLEYAITTGDFSFAETPALASIRRLVGLAKAQGVADLAAADLDGGYEKVLIFCQHTDVIRSIAEKLTPYGVGIFDGKVSQSERARVYDAFGDTAAPRVLVCQTQAAGEGLDKLKRANRVYLAEPSWTPKDNDQAIARAARRGQTKPVHASYVALADSLDAKITATVARKRRDISEIV